MLVDVSRWSASTAGQQRELGARWDRLLRRDMVWKMAAERTLFFNAGASETGTVFSREDYFATAFRDQLPAELRSLPLRFDLARHVHRPGSRGVPRLA